jgi:hypothetical protein
MCLIDIPCKEHYWKKIIQEMSIMIETGWEAVCAQEPFCREEKNSNGSLLVFCSFSVPLEFKN